MKPGSLKIRCPYLWTSYECKMETKKYKGNTKYKNSTLTEEIVISDMIWTCKEYCIAAFVNGS